MSEISVSTPARKSVQLGTKVHEIVKEYSNLTGISISRVLDDCITDWMSNVGAARIEALGLSQRKEATVIPFLKPN